jgi:hypothetical protein
LSSTFTKRTLSNVRKVLHFFIFYPDNEFPPRDFASTHVKTAPGSKEDAANKPRYASNPQQALGIRHARAFVAINLLVGLSCALPLFLYIRERAK